MDHTSPLTTAEFPSEFQAFIDNLLSAKRSQEESRDCGYNRAKLTDTNTDFFGYSHPHPMPPVLGTVLFVRGNDMVVGPSVDGKRRIVLTIRDDENVKAHFVRTPFECGNGAIVPSHPMPQDIINSMREIFPEVFGAIYPVPQTRFPGSPKNPPAEDIGSAGVPYTAGTADGRVYHVTPALNERGELTLATKLVRGMADGATTPAQNAAAVRASRKALRDLDDKLKHEKAQQNLTKAFDQEAKEIRRSKRAEAAKRAWVTIRKNKRNGKVRR